MKLFQYLGLSDLQMKAVWSFKTSGTCCPTHVASNPIPQSSHSTKHVILTLLWALLMLARRRQVRRLSQEQSFAVSAGTQRQKCRLCISLNFSRRTLKHAVVTVTPIFRVCISSAASHLIRRNMNPVSALCQYKEPTARIQP